MYKSVIVCSGIQRCYYHILTMMKWLAYYKLLIHIFDAGPSYLETFDLLLLEHLRDLFECVRNYVSKDVLNLVRMILKVVCHDLKC